MSSPFAFWFLWSNARQAQILSLPSVTRNIIKILSLFHFFSLLIPKWSQVSKLSSCGLTMAGMFLSLPCNKRLLHGRNVPQLVQIADFKFSRPVYSIQCLFHTNQSHHFKGCSVLSFCTSYPSRQIKATQHIYKSDWSKFPYHYYGAWLTSLRATLFWLRLSRYLPEIKLKFTYLTHFDLIWGALLATSVRQSS